MKITRKQLEEIIKEEVRSLVEEEDINIQRVKDIDQMVKNLLTTKALSWAGDGGDKAREQYFRENLNDIVQLIVNGEIYHYFISLDDLADPQGQHVEDDSIILDKLGLMLNKFHKAGSSGMKPQLPEFPKLRNITIHSSGEHAALTMDGFQGRTANEIKNYLRNLGIYPDKIGDGVVAFKRPENREGKQSFRDFFKDLKNIDNDWSYRDENGALEEQKTKLTKTRLIEIIKEVTEKILHDEPLEIQLLQKVLRDKMTPEEAKKRLPRELHKKFDYYLAQNKRLQNREALPQEPEEVPGLEEKTTDETLNSTYLAPVNKPTKKCPKGETMSSKSGKCEPNRVKPRLRREQ